MHKKTQYDQILQLFQQHKTINPIWLLTARLRQSYQRALASLSGAVTCLSGTGKAGAHAACGRIGWSNH